MDSNLDTLRSPHHPDMQVMAVPRLSWHHAKAALRESLVPVPRGRVASSVADAIEAFREIDGPVIVKPNDAGQLAAGAVAANTVLEVKRAYERLSHRAIDVVVEERFAGRPYHVHIVDGCLVAAAELVHRGVVGDGSSTVSELISMANARHRQVAGRDTAEPLIRSFPAGAALARVGKTFAYVPAVGEFVALTLAASTAAGGGWQDVTAAVHRAVIAMCEKVARVVDLPCCRVDLVARNIATSPGALEGVVGFRIASKPRVHADPSNGSMSMPPVHSRGPSMGVGAAA